MAIVFHKVDEILCYPILINYLKRDSAPCSNHRSACVHLSYRVTGIEVMQVEWKHGGFGEGKCFSDKEYVSEYHVKVRDRLQDNLSSVIRQIYVHCHVQELPTVPFLCITALN